MMGNCSINKSFVDNPAERGESGGQEAGYVNFGGFRRMTGRPGGELVEYSWRATRFGELLVGVSGGLVCFAHFVDDGDRVDALEVLGRTFPEAKLVETSGGRYADRMVAALEGREGLTADEIGLWGTDFQVAVWRAVCEIPRGEVRTYGQVAEMAGHPRASRAVGSALHVNPLTVLIPCHRVVSASMSGKPLDIRSVGRYFSSPEIKLALLEAEGADPYFFAI